MPWHTAKSEENRLGKNWNTTTVSRVSTAAVMAVSFASSYAMRRTLYGDVSSLAIRD